LSPVRAGKLTTRGGSLLVELQPTPKLILRLRDWFPHAWLAGWKYGVDGDRACLLDEARSQLTTCRTDVCVANGPAYGPGFGIVGNGPGLVHCADRTELCDALVALLREGRAGE
jgi:phosphopantothenoylcysteine decarboxylase/phosphopantothenate--cysteine ligase